MLPHHAVDNMDERLVAVEQTMTAGQDVSFEPALYMISNLLVCHTFCTYLDSVLREHLHDPSFEGQIATIFILFKVVA
jgi:hypothetical protein